MKSGGIASDIYTPARAPARWRVQKLNASSHLGGETRRPNAPAILNPPLATAPEASHFETSTRAAPTRNGMPATFIAQVLGQILETKRRDPAYGRRIYEARVSVSAERPGVRCSERA